MASWQHDSVDEAFIGPASQSAGADAEEISRLGRHEQGRNWTICHVAGRYDQSDIVSSIRRKSADLSILAESGYPDRMSIDTYVGHQVHERMWRARITQRAMAARLGIDESTLGRKIRGSRKWTLDEVVEAATILSVHPGDLLPSGGDGGAKRARRDSNPQPTG